MRSPSSRVTRRAVRNESASVTFTTRSTSVGSKVVGQKSSPTPFDEIRPSRSAREHRALGIGADDLHVGVLRLQVAGDAGDRAAGADAGDEVRDAPGGLAPDLGAGGQLVRARVGLVGVLVGTERARRLPHEAFGRRVVGARVFGRHRGRAHDHLGAVRAEQRDLLVAHLVAHHEDALVAPLGRDDREARAGVARGRLDDRAARLEQPGLLGRVDHRDGGPVLDAAAGVDHLDLGEQPAREVAPDPPQAHQRRVPDQVEDRVGDLHVGWHRARIAHPPTVPAGRSSRRSTHP